jgi:hypothetical protein
MIPRGSNLQASGIAEVVGQTVSKYYIPSPTVF